MRPGVGREQGNAGKLNSYSRDCTLDELRVRDIAASQSRDRSMNNPAFEQQPYSSAEPPDALVTVAILLSTYNGERFLVAQLESLLAQTHSNWVIYASDDGSTDSTLAILRKYQGQVGKDRFFILSGPGQGFAKNFMSLVKSPLVTADYVAFCDQDDLWLPNKLERSLGLVKAVPVGVPALYCSRTHLIDEGGNSIGFSPLFSKPPSFANALVQSIAGANTMLLNRTALELLKRTGDDAIIISHDWWAYILVSGYAGKIFYDTEPFILYRQHGGNLIGSNSSLFDRVVRLQKMLKGTFKYWNDSNLSALGTFQSSLSERCQNTLMHFENARKASLFRRVYLLRKAGVYRQTIFGNIGLLVASIINRV